MQEHNQKSHFYLNGFLQYMVFHLQSSLSEKTEANFSTFRAIPWWNYPALPHIQLQDFRLKIQTFYPYLQREQKEEPHKSECDFKFRAASQQIFLVQMFFFSIITTFRCLHSIQWNSVNF